MNEITLDFSFPTILDILSIATAFILGLLFVTAKTNNRKANVFLGLFLWSLGIEVLGSFVGSNELSFSVFQTSLLTIPCLFLYVNQTLNNKITWLYGLLLIPAIVSNFLSAETPFLQYFEYLFNITLLVSILKIIRKHQEKLADFYSDIEHKTLSWIQTIVYVFLFFHVLWIIEDIVGIQNEDFSQYFALISIILTFFMIYWIGYNGFSQREMFTSILFSSKEKEIKSAVEISDKTKQQFEEVSKIIQQKRLFANTNLNLTLLSNQLNLKEKELSKLINIHTKSNFYQFINGFRIEEFKKLLSSPKAKQLSLLGLAYEAGFSSKSTFYTAFKTFEGITPRQYQNQIKKSE